MALPRRNYIDISKKNQKGIIDSDGSGSNFIFEQNEIANQRAEDLAKLKKEADLAKQRRDLEIKKREMELLVAKQKAEELKKQQEEERQLQETKLALIKQQEEDKLASQKNYLEKDIKQSNPEIYELELQTKAKIAEDAQKNPAYISKRTELDKLLLEEKKVDEKFKVTPLENKIKNFEDDPESYVGERIANTTLNTVYGIYNGLYGLSKGLTDAAVGVFYKSPEQEKKEKLQKELQVFQNPILNLKNHEIEKVKKQKIQLYKNETNPLKKHQLEVEIWKDEQAQKDIANTINPSNKYVIGSIVEAMAGATDFDKPKDGSFGEEMNRIHFFPRVQANLSEWYSRRDLEEKYQDALVGQPGETPEQRKARFESIPKEDLNLLKSYSLRDEAKGLVEPFQSFGARQATSMESSLDMVALMLATEGMGAGLGWASGRLAGSLRTGKLAERAAIGAEETIGAARATGAETAVVNKKVFLEKGYIDQVEKQLLEKGTNKHLAKTTAMALDGMQLSAKVQVMNSINPNFVNENLSKGSYVDRDENGEIKNIYLQDKYYDFMKKMTYGYDTPDGQHIDGEKDSYVKRAAVLNRVQNRTTEQEEELQYIEEKLGRRTSLSQMTFEEDLETYKPMSKLAANLKGFRQNFIETATEVYTGPLLGKIGKGLVKAPYGIGKYATKIGDTYGEIGSKIATGKANVINSNKVFRYLDKNMTKINMPTFSGKTITGNAEEFAEEWIGSAANSLIDLDPKEFMDTTFDAQSNTDIGLQTAFMNLGFGALSVTATNSKLLANRVSKIALEKNVKSQKALQKQHEDAIEENKKEIVNQKEALKDESLSDDVRATKTKLIEDLETQNLNSKGAISSIEKKVRTTRPFYQDLRDYTDARNEIRLVNNALRTAHLDSDVNKVMNLASMSSTDLDAQKQEIERLKKEGVDTTLAEKILFNNVVANAIKTGTLKDLKGSLQAASAKGTLSPETQQSLQRAMQNVAHLEEVSEKYQKHPYLNKILGMESEAFNLSEEVETAKRNTANTSVKATEALKEMYPNRDFDLTTMFDDTDSTFSEAELKQMLASNDAIQNYKTAYDLQNKFQEQLVKTNKVVGIFKNEAKNEVNKKNVNIDIRKQLADIQAANDKETDVNDAPMYLYDNSILENENVKFDEKGKLIIDKGLIDYLFEINEDNYVGDWRTSHKISKEEYDKLKDSYHNRVDMMEAFKKVQDVQSQEVTPEEQVVDPEFSPEEDTDIETNPSDRIPVNSKKYKTVETATAALKQYEKPRKVKKGTHEVVQVDDYFIISKKLEEAIEEETPLDLEDNGTIEIINTEEEQEGFVAIEENYNEAMTDLLDSVFNEDVVFDMSIDNNENRFTPQQIELATAYLEDYYNEMSRKVEKKDITFEKLFDQMFHYGTNKKAVEMLLPMMAIVWRQKGNEFTSAQQASLYNKYYGKGIDRAALEEAVMATFDNIYAETVVVEPVDTSLPEESQIIPSDSSTNYNDTTELEDEIQAALEADKQLSDKERQSITPKAAFSSVKYSTYVDEAGDVHRVSNATDFRDISGVNFKELLDYDKYYTGYQAGVRMSTEEEWEGLSISNGRDADGNVQLIPFTDWLAGMEAIVPNFRETQEFIDRVPMFLLNEKGEKVSYLNDVAWYDTVNVYNPYGSSTNQNNPSEMWQRHISKGIENIRELRNNVKNGLDKVTIERNSEEGIYLKLKKEAGQPTISVSEANPQANIAVATSTTASGLQHNNKELTQKLNDGSAIFLNKPADIIQGHTYYVSRIGTNVLADGRKVETYRAFEVLREVSEDQVETVRNAYKRFQQYTWAVKNKDQAKIQELTETFIKPILKATGIDISKSFEKNGNIVYTGITDFIKMYFQADKKALQEVGVNSSDIHFAYERLFDKYSNSELAKEANQLLSQHTSKIALKAKNMVEVDKDGRVTLLEKEGAPVSYEEYVKDNVKTNIKALNIGTAENPKYVTVIQPIINIIGNPVAQPEVQTSEKIAETTKTIVEEIKATTQEAKNNPVQTERDITEEDKKNIEDFFNKLNINIDYEDIDEAIDNLDAINKLFNTSGNLDFKQEYAVKQFLIGKITGFLIDNKVDISKPISAEVKKEIFDTLKTEMDKIVQDRTAEVNAVKENLKTFKDNNTVSKITETVNSTLDNLKTLTEEYEAIFNKAFDKLKIDSKVIEEEDGDNSDVGIEDKNYSKESIETDLKKGVTPNLRLFLNSISQYDKQGNKVTTYLGLDSYMEFNEIFNQLIKNIAIGIDIPSDYNMLIETLQKSKAPFIKDVLEKLANADQQVKNTFLTTFVKHSLNSKSAQYSNINNVTKLKILENDSNEGKRVVKKEYLNALKMSGVYSQDGTVNLGFVKNLIDRYESLFKEYPTLVGLDPEATEKAQSEIRMLLEQSGLTMQDNTWTDILNNKFYNKGYKSLNDLYTLDNGGLLKPIMKFLKTLKEGDIYDNEKNILSDLGGVTNAIIKLEVANDTNLNSTSFRDSGKNISKLVPTKYITDKVADLKRSATDKDNNLISDLQSLSFSKDSVILQLLADYPEFQSIFSISHVGLEAMKEAGSPVFGKTGITDISDLDYFLATFTGFQDRRSEKLIGATIDGFPIRIANMLNLTMSDKSTNTFLQTGVFDFMASPLSFTTNDQGDLAISQEVKDLMIKQLIKPELERIANFYNTVKATNISDYDKAAKIFHLVPLLNTVTDSKGIRLIDKMAVMDNIDSELLLKEYNQQFSEIIAQVVNEEVNHFKEITGDKIGNMFDSEYFTEINAERSTDKALYDFVLNSMIHQADLFKVFAGDISNYSKDKQVAETGLDNKTTDAEYISLNKQIGVNLGKRLALLIAPGNKIANSYNEKYHQIFLQDSVDISENAKYLMDLYYPEKDKTSAYSDLEKYDEIAEAINKYEQGLAEISPEILEKYKDEQERIRKSLQKEFPSIKDYFDIESTDAQEYTTAKEHVNILFRLGRLNIEQYKRIMDNIENDVNLSKEDLKFVLQPIKPVHTGTYINKNQDVNRVVYIKTSSFPLLKQFTGPTKLDALRVKMEELETKTGNGVRASYKTGNKVGAVKSNNEVNPFDVQSLENIFNGFDATTNTFDENGMNNSVLTLDRNNFRIQQDVPFKSDKKKVDTVAMSTQFFKMLFGDGVIEEYNEKERDAFATFYLNGKMVTGKELYNHYVKSFKKLVDTKKQQLFRELEMSPEGEITNKLAFTQKLQEMLVKEATEKGYSLKSVRGLTIEKLQAELGYHYDFKTPLWLSTDSNRYESLLNSLITNRILQHKIPGNSYVAGSESGFRLKENLEGIDESKVIYLDNYNGKELQGTHTTTEEGNIVFHKAQVFVPSKFKTSSNELIDLFEGYNETSGSVANAKYLKRNENGSLGLKEEMLDKELLNLFSFRTPTSAHVSGASIEIAGFLPSIQGDLMIVPKNFTKQKGLDYDVDKEGTYMLNHVTNKDGKIEILTERHKYNSLKTLKSLLADENNVYRSDIGLPGMNHFYEMVRLEFGDDFVTEMQNEGANLENKVKSMELEYDKKLAENEFIKVHLAVYNNPSVNIQQKINKVLSIDVAKQQAKQLEEDNILKEKAKFISDRKLKGATDAEAIAQYETRQKSFTMLSYSYQKDKMNFGAIGKTAIGVYANATTLSSLMQQNENQIALADNGLIQIGDLIFDGKFGKVSTLNNSRSIADVLAERENIATDNEKEQVLTKVGINSETINVDALLTLAGFDTAEYVEKGKEPQTISLPFYLLSQPAITDFNNTLKNSKGVLGDYVDRNALVHNTILRLSNKKISYIKQGDGTYSFVNTKDGSEIKDLNGKILTPKNLVEGVKFNGQNLEVQAAALMTFVDLNEKAKVLQKVQSVLNTNDLGKSMVGSKLKYDKLKVISENGVFDNIEKLLGDFIKKDTVSEKPKGYYDIGDYYIKPTTPQGQIVINGLYIGNNIFKDFFPFQSEILNDTVKEIFESTGKSSEDISEESYEEIIDEVKKYIFSNKNNNIFNGDIDAVRFDLFKDTTTHDSLAKYIHSLVYNKQNTKALKSIKENALLNQLSFNINFDKEDTVNLLSTMSFNNTDSGTNNQENLYNAIPELIKNNYKLPDRNGMPYNTRMLATDLVAYTYLEGGIQEATQFVKVIPIEVLETLGNYKDVKQADGSMKRVFVTANAQLQKYNPGKYNKTSLDIFGKILGVNEGTVSDFTRQYFQQNPDKAKKVPRKQLVFGADETSATPQVFSFNPKFLEKEPFPFINLAGSLYEHRGNLDYYKVETIGGRGISEYKYGEKNVVNFDMKQKEIVDNNETTLGKQTNDAAPNFQDVKNINTALATVQDLSLSKEYEFLKIATQFLSQFQDNTTKFEVSTGFSSAGTFDKVINKVTLHQDTLSDANKTAMILAHEYLHSITSREIMNYYQSDGVTLKTDVSIPSHVQALHEVFSNFREQFSKEIAEITEKKKGNNKDNYTEDEKNIYYAGYNIREFLAMALTSVEFQNEMNKVAYPGSSKNFMEKLLEAIMKIVDTIYPELKKDTLAYEAVSKSMRFVVEEQAAKKSLKSIKLLTGEDLSLVNLADNQLGLTQIDTSKEVMNQKGSIVVPLNERISQKYPATVMGPKNNYTEGEMSSQTLLQLSLGDPFSPQFGLPDFYDKNTDDYDQTKMEEKFGKELTEFLLEVSTDIEENVTYSDLEFIRKAGMQGLAILDAYDTGLYEQSLPAGTTIQQFAKNLLAENVEYVDKNQTKLFEDETDEMISNNLITFDSSIEALGIPKKEWDNLSIEEQERIKKCN